jgi:homoserine kinase
MSANICNIKVPASTANIGPGFDVVGVALCLFLEVSVYKSSVLSISYVGSSEEERVPLDYRNLIVQSAFHLKHRKDGGDLSHPLPVYNYDFPYSLKIKNNIPLARGLGSSASAIVAGVLIANKIFGYNLSKEDMLEYILEIEDHPDNVGAALMGGLTVAYVKTLQERKVLTDKACEILKFNWNQNIKIIAIIPNYELSTNLARSVLPEVYGRSDVVFNLQRLAVLIPLLTLPGVPNECVIHGALKDKIHQNYRANLIPGMNDLIENLNPQNTKGYIGCVLSGAGPTLLILATSNIEEICEKSRVFFNDSPRVLELSVAEGGAIYL